jgi:hypothetical protein
VGVGEHGEEAHACALGEGGREKEREREEFIDHQQSNNKGLKGSEAEGLS